MPVTHERSAVPSGRTRLLLVAPVCDGTDTGEARVTFEWVTRLAERYDTTVLAQGLPGAVPLKDQLPHARVVEWVEPPVPPQLRRFNSMLKPAYPLFYLGVRRWLAQARRRDERFDLAHQLSPIAMRYPTPLAGSGIPYLLGPCGGSLTSPPAFRAEEATSSWYTRLRELDGVRMRYDPLLRRGFEEAVCILGNAEYVREALAPVAVRRFEVQTDSGVERLPDPAPGSDRTSEVRLLFVGRLVRTKGAQDVLRAMSLLPAGSVTLDVVGDGPDATATTRLTADLGLTDRVRFHGRVAYDALDRFYREADIFVFPSYREAGGIVVSEAMAHGLPVIVADRGGPASTVGADAGVRVPVATPGQLAEAVARELAGLVGDPERRRRLGAAARRRIRETGLWDRKVDALERLYADALQAPASPRTAAAVT